MERRTTIIISVLVAVALLLVVVEYGFMKKQEESGEEPEGGFFYTYFAKNLFGVTGEHRNGNQTAPAQTNVSSTTEEKGGILGRITSALRRNTGTVIAPEGAITPEGEFDPEAFRSLVENQTGVPSKPVPVDIGNGTSVILAIPGAVVQGLRELGIDDEFNRFLNLSLGEELNRVFGKALEYTQRGVPYIEQGVVWLGNQTAQALSSGISFLFSMFLSFIPVAVETVSQGVVIAVDMTTETITMMIGLVVALLSEVIDVAPEVISTIINSIVETSTPIINTFVETGTRAISSIFPSITSSLSKSLPSLGGTGLGSQLANTITSTLGGVDAVTFG